MAYVVTDPCRGVKDKSCIEVCPVDCFIEGEDQLFIIPDLCINCGNCESVCPVSAIFADEDVPAKWVHYIELNRTESDRLLAAK